jgi:glycosyltransferase involved in cell wall biosynthesis
MTDAMADKANGRRILYISYDGMLEPLGQSQVMAYLLRLSQGAVIHLVSFEKAEDWGDEAARLRVHGLMRQAGVVWHPLRYHKQPTAVATSWDILQGTLTGLMLVWRHRLKVVHARSYVAAVMALGIQKLSPARFLFDMRGFWPDERLDGGMWPKASRLYRVAKWFERKFLLQADAVVSLTQTAVGDMQDFDYMHGREQRFVVIPTCVDLDLFRPADPGHGRTSGPFVLGYVGSAGGWYLFDEAIRTYRSLLRHRPDARFLIVNRNEHDFIRERFAAMGVSMDQVQLTVASHHEVVGYIRQMDACVFYIKPVYSKRASAPTKLGELLACGVPCITNGGVGDSEAVLHQGRVGAVLQRFDDEAHEQGVQDLLALLAEPGLAARCREVADAEFALLGGVARYRQLYDLLTSPDSRRAPVSP